MNYLKKASRKLTNTIKSISKPSLFSPRNSKTINLLSSLINSKKLILSSTKMSELSVLSYDNQSFDEIINYLFEVLTPYTNYKHLCQIRNVFIVISYLLKHGPSGFIDQFRSNQQLFNIYNQSKYENKEGKDNKKIRSILSQIQQRVNYIIDLIQDNKRIQQEKQLVMLVKQKIILQRINKKVQQTSNIVQNQNHSKTQKTQKVSDFLENYVYHYWNKIDQKMEKLADRLIMKIDDYLVGEIPQQFQIDQLEQQPKLQSESNVTDKIKDQEQKFQNKRIMKESQQLI